MYKTPHFVTGNFVSHSKFVDDATYATILDTVVKATTDIFLCDEAGKVFLGKRLAQPHNDWWLMGGRMIPGETPQIAAVRILSREVGLRLDPVTAAARFRTVGTYTFVWDSRAQEPTNHGTADVSIIQALTLTLDEIAALKPHESEYAAAGWFCPSDLVGPAPPLTSLHPALRQGLNDYLAMRKWDQLQEAISQSESLVIGLLKEYIGMRQ